MGAPSHADAERQGNGIAHDEQTHRLRGVGARPLQRGVLRHAEAGGQAVGHPGPGGQDRHRGGRGRGRQHRFD
ncbi:MAG TPA: hypothetical protein VIX84_19740, partial [Acidimicrobiales bacterium]